VKIGSELILFCAAVAALSAAAQPIVVLNEDNDRYFYVCGEAGLTVTGLEAYVDRIAGGKITHFFMCPSGQRTSYDSKAWEPIWTALDEPGGADSRWAKNAKALRDRGLDPYQVWIRRCRARGISPWLSPRMNDAHNANMEWSIRNTTFWRTRKDLRNPGGTLNFEHQEVQDYTFALVKEQLDRYDVDGYELDFMRFDQYFPVNDATNYTPHLDRFVQRVHDYVTAKSAARGHPILLGVRVPTTPRAALSRGADVGLWARSGWVDWVCASSPWRTPDYNMPVDEWRKWFGAAAKRITFLSGTDHGVTAFKWERTDMTPEFYAGFADVAWGNGVDGIYLFNASYLAEALATVCRKGLFPADLPAYRRRYPVSFRDTSYGVVPDDRQLPRLSDRVNRFTVRLGAQPVGDVSVLVGVCQEGPFNPPITLNGARPTTSRTELFTVVCRDHPDRAIPYHCRRWFFPADAVHPGPDNVIELQPSETKMSIGWVEIALGEGDGK